MMLRNLALLIVGKIPCHFVLAVWCLKKFHADILRGCTFCTWCSNNFIHIAYLLVNKANTGFCLGTGKQGAEPSGLHSIQVEALGTELGDRFCEFISSRHDFNANLWP